MSRKTDLMDNYLGIYQPEQEYFTFPFLKEQYSDSDQWKKFDPWPREGRPKYQKQPKPEIIETRWSKLQEVKPEPVPKIKTNSLYERIKEEREEKKRQAEDVESFKIEWDVVSNRRRWFPGVFQQHEKIFKGHNQLTYAHT